MPEIIDGARYVGAPRECGVCNRPFGPDDRIITLDTLHPPTLEYPSGSRGVVAIHDTLACREPVGRYLAQQGRTLPDR